MFALEMKEKFYNLLQFGFKCDIMFYINMGKCCYRESECHGKEKIS